MRFPPESIRFAGEAGAARELLGQPWVRPLVEAAIAAPAPDPARVRRSLMAGALQLTESMAPEAWSDARQAAAALGVDGELLLFQAAGAENALIHLVRAPVLLEIRGRLLPLLDAPSRRALFGHELGHWLAHGPDSPLAAAGLVATTLLSEPPDPLRRPPAEALRAASALSMARELTADRFGLLAAGDLDACLRLEMAATTGLSSAELTLDTGAYLAQCRALAEEALARGEGMFGQSHPEHGLRAWALWLWSESDRYRELTGRGPGHRPLAEVEEEIGRLLGALPEEGLVDGALLLDALPEIHECALAGAALVALADGELSEAEVQAIEAVFGARVADWQRYLVWDNALEAFHDTGAVVRRAGAGAQRGVFQVLLHVLAADAEVHEAEVGMVCAVGDALGCGTMYRALLGPTLARLGALEAALQAPVSALPLPARAEEADAALRTLLTGLARRGGGAVRPRLLYRMLGDPEGSETSRRRIEALCGALGLRPEPPAPQGLARLLESWSNDREMRLVPVRVEGFAGAPLPDRPADAGDPARQRLVSAFSRLRDQLIGGDGRSPAVRLRSCRRGRAFDLYELEKVSVGHAERVLTLAGAQTRARLVDGREVGGHEAAAWISSELLALEREALARREETGARDLCLGTPFLTASIDGYLLRGPLRLLPVDLERQAGGGYQLLPTPDEPPMANLALLRLLFTRLGRAFPDSLSEELDQAAAEGEAPLISLLVDHGLSLGALGEALGPFRPRDEELAGLENRKLFREEVAVLGFFPQSSSDLIQDYDALIRAAQEAGTELGSRLGAAAALLPADIRHALGVGDPPAPPDPPAPIVPVVPTDESQRRALMAARSARLLVVDGPPGTGKSQVIVNLVVDALAAGEPVAVVCEKRAALDVVAQRLEAIGLRHLLAIVHDVHEDRRPLYEQIQRRLDEGLLRTAPSLEAVEQELADLEAALRGRREALARALGPDRPGLGSLHALAASFRVAPLTGLDPSLLHEPYEAVRALAERVGREAARAELHRQGSVWRQPPETPRPSMATLDEAGLHALEAIIAAGRPLAAALDRERAAQGRREESLLALQPLLARVVEERPARAEPFLAWAVGAFLGAAEHPGLEARVRALEQAWVGAEAWISELPQRVELPRSEELELALARVEADGVSIFRYLSPAWWSARGVLRRPLARLWPAGLVLPTAPPLARKVRLRQQATAAWAALDGLLNLLGKGPELPDAGTALSAAQGLVRAWSLAVPLVQARDALRAAGVWSQDLESFDRSVDERLRLLGCARALEEELAPVRAWLPGLPVRPTEKELERLHEAWAVEAASVVLADRNLDAAHRCARELVQRLADGGAVEEGGAAVEGGAAWAEAVEHGWARMCIEAIERRDPGVRALDRPLPMGEVGEAEARLGALVEQRGRLFVQRVLAACDEAPLLTEARPGHRARRSELQRAREQMLREASKKRHVLSLRGYVRQFADQGLLEVLPVWLLSPETMAILFPGQPVFARVIIDEASQATVEKGLPALVRARTAVVAGDERQMPPTRFFELRAGEEDEPGTEQTVQADALMAESLLVLARERCPHQGLRWHYRCLYEELIAFSNYSMYGGQLYTIPSPVRPEHSLALRWVAVEDGRYDRGANPVEAERVVDELGLALAEDPGHTLGVITFNIQQQRAIQDAIDARRARDPGFGAAWAAAMAQEEVDRRPFVKNLESVQGDERDFIIFSLGHAPVVRASGPLKGRVHVPARFGPLGQVGGERRLNVAISRARLGCTIVASFEPSHLSVASTTNDGPKLFKAFLEFCWEHTRGQRQQAARTLARVRGGGLGAERPAPPPAIPTAPTLAAQIAVAVEELGLCWELDLGSSGFRVPLALRRPDDPRWRLAVLTEEHPRDEVDEAHRHRPAMLRARGWRVLRVDARAWDRDRRVVLAKVVGALGEG